MFHCNLVGGWLVGWLLMLIHFKISQLYGTPIMGGMLEMRKCPDDTLKPLNQGSSIVLYFLNQVVSCPSWTHKRVSLQPTSFLQFHFLCLRPVINLRPSPSPFSSFESWSCTSSRFQTNLSGCFLSPEEDAGPTSTQDCWFSSVPSSGITSSRSVVGT